MTVGFTLGLELQGENYDSKNTHQFSPNKDPRSPGMTFGMFGADVDIYVNAASIAPGGKVTGWRGIAEEVVQRLKVGDPKQVDTRGKADFVKDAKGEIAKFNFGTKKKDGSPKTAALIHAGAPIAKKPPVTPKDREEEAEALKSAYLNILIEAEKLTKGKPLSIAIPSLGTGIYGNAVEASAKAACDAVEEFKRVHSKSQLNIQFAVGKEFKDVYNAHAALKAKDKAKAPVQVAQAQPIPPKVDPKPVAVAAPKVDPKPVAVAAPKVDPKPAPVVPPKADPKSAVVAPKVDPKPAPVVPPKADPIPEVLFAATKPVTPGLHVQQEKAKEKPQLPVILDPNNSVAHIQAYLENDENRKALKVSKVISTSDGLHLQMADPPANVHVKNNVQAGGVTYSVDKTAQEISPQTIQQICALAVATAGLGTIFKLNTTNPKIVEQVHEHLTKQIAEKFKDKPEDQRPKIEGYMPAAKLQPTKSHL